MALTSITPREFCRAYRIGMDKVRGLIARGELRAVNVANPGCTKPQFIITPDAIREWEQRRTHVPPPKKSRRRKPAELVDMYP